MVYFIREMMTVLSLFLGFDCSPPEAKGRRNEVSVSVEEVTKIRIRYGERVCKRPVLVYTIEKMIKRVNTSSIEREKTERER